MSFPVKELSIKLIHNAVAFPTGNQNRTIMEIIYEPAKTETVASSIDIDSSLFNNDLDDVAKAERNKPVIEEQTEDIFGINK